MFEIFLTERARKHWDRLNANAVDDYLAMNVCGTGEATGETVKGSFNIRLSAISIKVSSNAADQKMTLNTYIKTVLEQVVMADR